MPFTLGPRAASTGYRLVAFERTGSTNAEALARARGGERGPVWFVTPEQTAGRGRRNRPWIAPRGNLAASILEAMDIAPAKAATLGFAAGLALDAALRAITHDADEPRFALKWPNDVMAGGRKLAGILLEAEAVSGGIAVVVGIGTNVVAAPTGTPVPTVSLKLLGIETSAEALFAALSDGWAEFRSVWSDGSGFGEIRRLWLQRAAGLGERVAIKSGSAVIEGTFETIDEQGCMMVRTPSGRLAAITAGDVYFGSAASMGAT
jgi:BirA family transcriptional regulator, biotin operon repressor / biotin---[acetyl-CoA-carboxylase] ligase